MSDEWISIPVAARLRGVSEKTVHNWIDAKLIRARIEQHGRQRRRFVDKSELMAFAQGQQSDEVRGAGCNPAVDTQIAAS